MLDRINEFYLNNIIKKDRNGMKDVRNVTWTINQSTDDKSDGDMCDELIRLLSDLYGRDDMRICVGHCTNFEDGIHATSAKTTYVMAKDVTSNYNDDMLSGHVKKLSLPASRCWYRSSWIGRKGKAPLGDRCPPIPGITFACVKVDGAYKHNEAVCGDSNNCRGKTTNTLGRIFRIDCGMSHGFHYTDKYRTDNFVKPVLDTQPAANRKMLSTSFDDYLREKLHAAQTAQTLEIILPESAGDEETVNHVIALTNVDALFQEHAFESVVCHSSPIFTNPPFHEFIKHFNHDLWFTIFGNS
jgi:hypothetical protein